MNYVIFIVPCILDFRYVPTISIRPLENLLLFAQYMTDTKEQKKVATKNKMCQGYERMKNTEGEEALFLF